FPPTPSRPSPPPLCPSPPLFRSGPPSRRPLPVRAAAPIKKGILFYVTATLPRPGPGAGPPPDAGAARILRRAGAAAGPVRSVQFQYTGHAARPEPSGPSGADRRRGAAAGRQDPAADRLHPALAAGAGGAGSGVHGLRRLVRGRCVVFPGGAGGAG